MYKPGGVIVCIINGTGTWYDTSNITGMYENYSKKVQQSTQHGKARQSTTLRSAELELQGIAGHCTALLCGELYIALRWGAARRGADEPSPDLS